MSRKASQSRDEQIAMARMWLNGYIVHQGEVQIRKTVEDGTPLDKDCRAALSQLLIDRAAPPDVLDSIANLIAPTVSTTVAIGEQLFRSGSQVADLSLSGTEDRLVRIGRSNIRRRDGFRYGYILMEMQRLLHEGKTREAAAFDISERLCSEGVAGASQKNILKVWDCGKIVFGHAKTQR